MLCISLDSSIDFWQELCASGKLFYLFVSLYILLVDWYTHHMYHILYEVYDSIHMSGVITTQWKVNTKIKWVPTFVKILYYYEVPGTQTCFSRMVPYVCRIMPVARVLWSRFAHVNYVMSLVFLYFSFVYYASIQSISRRTIQLRCTEGGSNPKPLTALPYTSRNSNAFRRHTETQQY